jgi:hypothetical protein
MWALIGTAGRKDDAPLMSKELFYKALDAVKELAKEYNIMSWTSGGAAWMDHLMIELILNAERTEVETADGVKFMYTPNAAHIHLPCRIDSKTLFNARYPDGKYWYCKAWEARTANYYHEIFSKQVYGNPKRSRQMILEAVALGLDDYSGRIVTCSSGGGFSGRNGEIANDADDGVIALTFSETGAPKDGGTMNTWRENFRIHPSAKRRHIDLGSL